MGYGVTGIIVDTGVTSLVQGFALGTKHVEVNASGLSTEYEYVKASAAIAINSACKIDDDGTIARLTTTLAGTEPTRVGFAQVAFASGEFGWVAIRGAFNVLAAANCVQDVKLYTTATAGVLDDDGTSTKLIQGVKILTTVTTATATPAFSAGYAVINAQD